MTASAALTETGEKQRRRVGKGGREVQKGGDICTSMANSY